MKPTWEQFLHGARGERVVVMPQRAIDVLYKAARLREVHARLKGHDPLVDAVLVAIALAAQEHSGSEVGTKPAPQSEPATQSPTVTTKALADRTDLTTRAVTKAIVDGRLDAAKDSDGRWRIPAAAADAFARNN